MGGTISQEAQDVHAKPLFRVSISRPSRPPLIVQINADPVMPPCPGSYGDVFLYEKKTEFGYSEHSKHSKSPSLSTNMCPQPKYVCQLPESVNTASDIRDGGAGERQFEGCLASVGTAGPLVRTTKAGSTLQGKRARMKEKGRPQTRRRQESNPGEMNRETQEPAAMLATLSQSPERSCFQGSETKVDRFLHPTSVVAVLSADAMSKYVTVGGHLSWGKLSDAEFNSSRNGVKLGGDHKILGSLLEADASPVQSLKPHDKIATNVLRKVEDTRSRTKKKAVPVRRWVTNGKEFRNRACGCSGYQRCDCSHPTRIDKAMNAQKVNLDKLCPSEVLKGSHESSFAVCNKLQEELLTRIDSQVTSNGSTVTVQVEHSDKNEKKIARINVNKGECGLDIMPLIMSDGPPRQFVVSTGSCNDARVASFFASKERIRPEKIESLIGNRPHKNISTSNYVERSRTTSNDPRQNTGSNAYFPSPLKKRRSSFGPLKKSNKEDMGSRSQETKLKNKVESFHDKNGTSQLATAAEKKLGCEDSHTERRLAAPADMSLPLFRFEQWCEGHPFEEGEFVEVRSLKPGYRGAWFCCRIEKCRFYVIDDFSPMLPQYLVRYIDYPDEKPEWINVYDRDKRKDCDPWFQLMMRPFPPRQLSVTTVEEEVVLTATDELELVVLQKERWEEGDKVDWACDGCWWVGTVYHTAEDHVLLRLLQVPEGEGNGKLEKALFKDLRATLLWDKGVWSFPRPPQESLGQGVAGGQLVYLPKSVATSRCFPGQHVSIFEGTLPSNSSISSEINMTSSSIYANKIRVPETPYSMDKRAPLSPDTDNERLCNRGPPSELGSLSAESAQSEQYNICSSKKEHHNMSTPLSICAARDLNTLSINAISSEVLERMSSVQSENKAEHRKISESFQMQDNSQPFLGTSPSISTPGFPPSWKVPRRLRSRRAYQTVSILKTNDGLE